MSQSTVPPFSSSLTSPSKHALTILEKRLKSAEDDTHKIIASVEDSGILQKGIFPTKIRGVVNSCVHVVQGNGPDADLGCNYEALVGRVCRTESAIQTLKLSLLNIHGDKVLTKKSHLEVDEKLAQARQAFELDMIKLRQELESLREDLTAETAAKIQATQETKQFKASLDEIQTEKASLVVTLDEVQMTNKRLFKQVSELKDALHQETSIRVSLEESHNFLLTRIQDLEAMLENEHREVLVLTEACQGYKSNAACFKEELSEQRNKAVQFEKAYVESCHEKEKLQELLSISQQEQQAAVADVSQLREQYDNLIQQLDQMQKYTDEQKSRSAEIEQENSRLQTSLQTVNNELGRLQTRYQQKLEEKQQGDIAQTSLEEETTKMKMKVKNLSESNKILKQNVSTLEAELESTQQQLERREQEYKSALAILDKEMALLQQKLKTMQEDKQQVLQQKENLLEEVNQAVDSLIEERTALQNEMDQMQLENNTLHKTQQQLEKENAQLIERITTVEHQEAAQQQVEMTLRAMLDQKNKLAYENGRLQMQLQQLAAELGAAVLSSSETAQIRKLSQSLQTKYSQTQKKLSDARIASQRLEMQLQTAQENLLQMERDHAASQVQLTSAEQEVARLTAHVQMVEERENDKILSSRRSLEDAKSVNLEITNTLEAVMASHSQLQSIVENLQVELGRKDTQLSQLKTQRNQEQEALRQELKTLEGKMDSLKGKAKQEKDRAVKKTNRDIAEIKKQNDNLETQNTELVKANSKLQQQVAELEHSARQLEQKLTSQEHKLDHLHKAKLQLEENLTKMKDIHKDIEDLEIIRDEYMKKHQVQAQATEMFMNQIASLQEELKELMTAQKNTSELLMQKAAMDKERHQYGRTRGKVSSRGKENMALNPNKDSEQKLQEIHKESLEISQHLQEADKWFRSKFDKLQLELSSSRQMQAKLEQENHSNKKQLEKERSRVREATQRAKEMIKASCDTINQLAGYTEPAHSKFQGKI